MYSFINYRSMLSAAHALAIDAKNLLDVVDAIRVRFPQIQARILAQAMKSNSEQIKMENVANFSQSNFQVKSPENQHLAKTLHTTEGNYDNAQIMKMDDDKIKSSSIPVATITTIQNRDNSTLMNTSQRGESSYITQIDDQSENNDLCKSDSKDRGSELKIVETAESTKNSHINSMSNTTSTSNKQETVMQGIILPKPASCAFIQQHQPVYSQTQKINLKLPHFMGKLQEK